VAAVGVVLAAGLAVSLVKAGAAPVGFPGDLFGDSGVNFLVAGRLAAGDRLYRDVQYPYGPVSAYLYAAYTLAAGNSPASYAWFERVGSLAHIALVMVLLLRYTRPAVAAAVGVFG